MPTEQGDLLTTKHASPPATDTANVAEAVVLDAGPAGPTIPAGLSADDAGPTDAETAQGEETRAALRREMDALSLTQALLDFEMANARVLDLTARLVEANGRVLGLQAEADAARRTIDEVRSSLAAKEAELVDLKASRSYKLAERLQTLLRVLRG